MFPTRRASILALSLCTAAVVLAPGAPASAAPPAPVAPAAARPTGEPAPSTVLLSVRPAESTDGQVRRAVLRCDADGGTHRSAAIACDDLRSVDGDLRALAVQDGICTREYRPVTATAIGVWRGSPFSYRAVFANRCLLLQATGNVFNF